MSTKPVKEIVVEHITSVEQLENLPGYTRNINPKEVEFEDIVGFYHFSEEIPCQKSSCHTPHQKGYAVKLVDGRVTNVGNVCGKELDPENFVARRVLADRFIKRKLLVDHLITEKNRLDEYRKLLEGVRAEAKIVKDGQAALESAIGTPLYRKLCHSVRHRELDVYQHKETKEHVREYSSDKSETVKRRVVRVRAGRFNGPEFLGSDVRGLVFDGIKPAIDLLETIDFEDAPTPILTKLSNALGEIPAKIAQISRLKEQQTAFFNDQKNFELLLLLALDLPPEEVMQARAKVADYMARKFTG